MAIPTITLLPTAPQSSSPADFRIKADLFVAALNVMDDELNATIAGINTISPALDAASANVNFQGTWNSGTAYTVGQSVILSGITYVAILAGTNQNPSTATTYWLPTGISSVTHGATSKTTPVDADEIGLIDSASSFGLKRLTWANLKATLNAYIATIYAPLSSPAFTGTPTAPTAAAGTNTTQIATTAFAMGAGIGINQTWQNVIGSRVSGTTYTNSTGKPILVNASVGTAQNAYITASVGAVVINNPQVNGAAGTQNTASVSFIVPNGSTYSVTATLGAIGIWAELR